MRYLRHLLRAAAASLWAIGLPHAAGSAADVAGIAVDYRALVSQADLIYRSPAGQPIEGQPIGNGSMGTLVWTVPNGIGLQVNRCDVFAVNKTHAGPQYGPTDYCGACGQIAIDLGGRPFAPGPAFAQRLSLYEAETTIAGEAIAARCLVSAVTDVLAVEIDDRRDRPQPVQVTLSMWREPRVTQGSHVAQYDFAESKGAAVVVQRFRDQAYHCAAAVAVRVAGAAAGGQRSGKTARTISLPAAKGRRTILISSAASWSPDADVAQAAADLLGNAGASTYDDLRREHTRWWQDFWSRTFVHATSADGLADFIERVRYLHLYYMASTSRGPVPAKWNGSLFSTAGDARSWGSQYWVWTTEMPYIPLLAAAAFELTDPFFNMYVRQLPDAERAARQRWNARGAFFPETAGFDGPVVLPDDIAMEFQRVLFGQKKPAELSDRARRLCEFEGHLYATTRDAPEANPNDLPIRRKYRPYCWISHIASSGSELAVHAWWRYRYTGDREWLRSHAYPLLRGAVEFYRSLAKKGADGRYHLAGTNAHEDFWGVGDSIMDLAAIRGTAPPAIRAAGILGVDADLRAAWQELLDNLAPYPLGSDVRAKALPGGALADDVWSAGYLGDVKGRFNPEDVWLNPIFPFEDWTLETRSPPVDRMVRKLLALAPRHRSVVDQGSALSTAIRTPIAAARAGCGSDMSAILASYYAAFSPLPNGLSLFEGDNAQSVEHLGLLSTVVQEALLQSVSARPGGPEIISVFPAWPKQWEASFRLAARGGFYVTAAVRGGKVELVEIESRLGETCRLRNPWGTPCLLAELGGRTQSLAGDTITFDTARGKRYRIVPKGGEPPAPRRIAPTPTTEPASYSWKLPNGKTAEATLGRRR